LQNRTLREALVDAAAGRCPVLRGTCLPFQKVVCPAATALATTELYTKAKQFGVKLAFGTDLLFNPPSEDQGAQLARLGTWFSPYEVLKIATADNAELLELSGPRHSTLPTST
jgi:imidazolonepropionase-like amidohydrolase